MICIYPKHTKNVIMVPRHNIVISLIPPVNSSLDSVTSIVYNKDNNIQIVVDDGTDLLCCPVML